MDIDERTTKVGRSRTLKIIRDLYGLSDKAVLDIGCGFGEYLRLFGPGSIGITTTQEEIVYGKDNNLSILFGNAERLENTLVAQKFDVVWANNLFEHLLSPHAFLMKLKPLSKDGAIVIVGVPVVPKIVSSMRLRWFRGALASNHVNFFTHQTLRLTVERAGWSVIEVRPFLFTHRILDIIARPFAPHQYVVAVNNSTFKYPVKKLKEWITDDHYGELLAITHQK